MKLHSFKSFLFTITVGVLLLVVSIGCGPAPDAAPQEVTVDPLRFTQAVNEFKAADSVRMPRPNSVLFVGSSSIRGWTTLTQDFPEINVINRGFGGSHMSDLIFYLDDLVFPYNPNAIVIYEGDNDIADGKTPEKVFADYLTFITAVQTKWPQKPIFFISIKPSLARVNVLENMAKANALIKAYIDTHETLYYIDVYSEMLGADKLPKPELFGPDGLHMNAEGYALWTGLVKRELGLE